MNETSSFQTVFQSVQLILIWAIPILFAVTLHEAAHGYVASKLGDKTALLMGRVTLNPFKHIDLVGTILVPIIFLILGGFIFGWAKPVPVDWRRLNHPKRDMALVALAGPGANLVMAIFWGIMTKLGLLAVEAGQLGFKVLAMMGLAGIAINIMLMVLNLIPIPPLDGSRVVSSLLSPTWAEKYDSLDRFGFVILILLIVSGALAVIIQPLYVLLQKGIFFLFQLNLFEQI